ncbi:MAG: hypothetical protein FJ087_11435 [Deltaproteobacteria bacterium]|nr:hypothetical protein [Deltaproteobacteria bacterium]
MMGWNGFGGGRGGAWALALAAAVAVGAQASPTSAADDYTAAFMKGARLAKQRA